MDERVARTISKISSLDALARFEANARRRNALTNEVCSAIKARSGELGRALVAERTGLDLTNLSPAEEKIIEAVSEYVGVMKKDEKDATRTLIQLRNRGLIGAAEAAVSRSTPTQGFQTLADADLVDLSYEQIIVDHPEEFSLRAIWFSRRTLRLPNEGDRPPPNTAPDKKEHGLEDEEGTAARNPPWSRDELILALDLYLRFRNALPAKDSLEIAELSAFLSKMSRSLGQTQGENTGMRTGST